MLINDNSNIENYKENLMNYLVDAGNNQPKNTDELECYINLLSFFIFKDDEDYLYNLPFLREQHNKFRDFLSIAPQKLEALKELASNILAIPTVKQFIDDPLYFDSTVCLSINDFLWTDLKLPGVVKFHDHFSIAGGKCNSRKDCFTLKIDDAVYSWYSSSKKLDELAKTISSLILKLYYEGAE